MFGTDVLRWCCSPRSGFRLGSSLVNLPVYTHKLFRSDSKFGSPTELGFCRPQEPWIVRFCHEVARESGAVVALGGSAGSGAFGSLSTHFCSCPSSAKTIRSWSTFPDASSQA